MLESALVALFAFGLVLELALMFGKDFLLGTQKQAALDEKLQQAQADLRASRQKIEERKAALRAAADESGRQRAMLQEADKAFHESQKVVPTLVHVIGMPHSGALFRAMVSKELPPKPDKSQQRIWACKNFIEVWADDLNAAKAAVAKQFQEKQGYRVGELMPCAPEPPRSVPEVAA